MNCDETDGRDLYADDEHDLARLDMFPEEHSPPTPSIEELAADYERSVTTTTSSLITPQEIETLYQRNNADFLLDSAPPHASPLHPQQNFFRSNLSEMGVKPTQKRQTPSVKSRKKPLQYVLELGEKVPIYY
jgi:hypothetical protein